jgi:hypothetical protein
MLLFGRILLHTEPGIYMIAHLCREENNHLGGIKSRRRGFWPLFLLYILSLLFA